MVFPDIKLRLDNKFEQWGHFIIKVGPGIIRLNKLSFYLF